ncbi:MAG: hypothetical protein JNG83_09155 [Opitutaceae bacterium]|nr:hypothetical protein [Opitutaceae bacterium]
MNAALLTTVAATGFTVAFSHAAIPTHWLPFVLVSRARGWSRGKTLAVSALAGLGHVALTSLIGLAIAWFGFRIDAELGEVFPWITGGILLAIGAYYFWRQWRGGIVHHHVLGAPHHPSEQCGQETDSTHWDHELKGSKLVEDRTTDWTAVSGLFVMLTLSPCEGFLPVYLSGVQFGWRGFIVLSLILALATLAGMMIFTWLALVGLERVQVKSFERFESGLLGLLFTLLGGLLIVLGHGH